MTDLIFLTLTLDLLFFFLASSTGYDRHQYQNLVTSSTRRQWTPPTGSNNEVEHTDRTEGQSARGGVGGTAKATELENGLARFLFSRSGRTSRVQLPFPRTQPLCLVCVYTVACFNNRAGKPSLCCAAGAVNRAYLAACRIFRDIPSLQDFNAVLWAGRSRGAQGQHIDRLSWHSRRR